MSTVSRSSSSESKPSPVIRIDPEDVGSLARAGEAAQLKRAFPVQRKSPRQRALESLANAAGQAARSRREFAVQSESPGEKAQANPSASGLEAQDKRSGNPSMRTRRSIARGLQDSDAASATSERSLATSVTSDTRDDASYFTAPTSAGDNVEDTMDDNASFISDKYSISADSGNEEAVDCFSPEAEDVTGATHVDGASVTSDESSIIAYDGHHESMDFSGASYNRQSTYSEIQVMEIAAREFEGKNPGDAVICPHKDCNKRFTSQEYFKCHLHLHVAGDDESNIKCTDCHARMNEHQMVSHECTPLVA